jgi:hypothetical protein
MIDEPIDESYVDEQIAGEASESIPEPVIEPIALAPEPILPSVPTSPPSDAEVILSIKSDGEFLPWVIDSALEFLDLADLERVKTAGALRGQKEDKIRDRINMANSLLVLLANYGSQKDDEALVKACTLYAGKMQTIIKRLCL